ncbi:nuclear GTPase SLIP-GC, partial [Rhinophrynus dorsalis]
MASRTLWPKLPSWDARMLTCKEIVALQQEPRLPQTHIAVVGDTGAGKSSLLNALLEQENVLPTSAMRACTAAVVEISRNPENGYRAEVEFLSEEEWDSEMKALITDIKDKSGRLRKRPNKPEARVAYNRVMAVYGYIDELHVLKADKTITKNLGKVENVSEKTASAFRSAIEKYIDTHSEQNQKRKGGQFWPIVKCVKIFIPDAEVLRTGAVLVDLPGTRDSNAARDSIAKKYLQSCDVVWVVTNITSAVDDQTAKELLGASLKRQLYMDGHLNTMAVICTKTDMYNVEEITRPYDLPIELFPGTIPPRGKTYRHSETEKKALLIRLLQQKKDESLRSINLICVQARNSFSKQRIRQDFYNSLREMGRSEGDQEEDDDQEDNELESIPEGELSTESYNLAVFTVSSKEYLDLRRRVPHESCTRVFTTERDTEIPDLRDFAIQTALRSSMLSAERVIRDTARIISQVITYLTNRKAQDERHQALIESTVESCLEDLRNGLQNALSKCDQLMTRFIQEKIKGSLEVGVRIAEQSCESTAWRWGIKESGGYPYPTYRAICSRKGSYSSATWGVVDFNEQLSQPMTYAITKSWTEVFRGSLVQWDSPPTVDPPVSRLAKSTALSLADAAGLKHVTDNKLGAILTAIERRIAIIPDIKVFLQGVAHAFPAYKAPSPPRDLNLVLGVLQKPPFEPLPTIPMRQLKQLGQECEGCLSSPLPLSSLYEEQGSMVAQCGELIEVLHHFNQLVLRLIQKFFQNLKSRLSGLGPCKEMIIFIENQQLKSTQAELQNFLGDQSDYISRRQRSISRVLTPEVQSGMMKAYN